MADVVDSRTVQLEVVLKGYEELNARLKAIEASAKSTADSVAAFQSQVKGIGEGIDAMSSRITGAVAGIVTAFASLKTVEAFAEGIQGSIELQGSLVKLSQQTAISIEALSGLRVVSHDLGIDFGTVTVGMGKLSLNMIEAASGTGRAATAFASLGINARQMVADGVPAEQMLVTVAEKLSSMSNESQRVAYAQQIFGRSGRELIPVLLEIAQAGGIEAQVTAEQAARAEDYMRVLRTLQSVKQQVYNTISQQVLPVLKSLADLFLENAKGADGLLAKTKQLASTNSILTWATDATVGILGLIERFLDFGNQVALVIKGFGVLGGTIVDSFAIASRATTAFLETLNTTGLFIRGILQAFSGQYLEAYATLSEAAGKLKNDWSGAWGDIKAKASDIGSAWKGLSKDIEELKSHFGSSDLVNAFLDKLKANLEKVSAAAKPAGTDIANLSNETVGALSKMEGALAKEVASLNANLASWQEYGVGLKSTALAATGAQIAELQLNGTLDKLRRTVGEDLVSAVLSHILVLAQQKDQVTESVKVWEDYSGAVKRATEEDARRIQSIVDAIEKQRDENATLGLATSAVTRYAAGKLEARKAILSMNEGSEQVIKALDEEIAKLNELANVQFTGENLKAFNSMVMQAADLVGGIARGFTDGVGKGIDAARAKLKSFVADLLELFAKKWFLQIVAGVTGSTAIGATAASLGQGTLSGAVGNALGSGLTSLATPLLAGSSAGFIGGGLGAEFMTGVTSGLVPGMGIVGEIGAFLGPIGIALLAVAAAIAIFSKPGGGPKQQGAFAGTFSSSGGLLVTLDGPSLVNITGDNQQVTAAQNLVQSIATGYAQIARSLGITGSQFNFGAGFSTDPQGTAPSFAHFAVQNAQGATVFQDFNDNIGRTQQELQAALDLGAKRSILAALQNSDLPKEIADILDSVSAISATADEINQVITKAQEMAAVMKGLATLSIKGLDVDALQAMQRDGESISQTFTRVASTFAGFNDAFMSDAEKLAVARQTVTQGFDALGISVPKSRADFLSLVKSIDFSTESGRQLFDALTQLAPAFEQVAAAADKTHEAFMSIRDTIDQLNGVTDSQRLSSLAGQFETANPWSSGMTPEELIAALKTITEEDFSGYSTENQALIKAILDLALQLQGNTTALQQNTQVQIDPAYAIPQATTYQNLLSGFQNTYGNIIGEQPTYIDRFSTEVTLMRDQITAWTARAQQLEQQYYGHTLPPEYNALLEAIRTFAQQTGGSYYLGGGIDPATGAPRTGDAGTGTLNTSIAQILIDSARYGAQKAQQLFDLQQWYDQQRALVSSNADALVALEQLYGDRRAAILNDTASTGTDALDELRRNILKWRDSLLLTNLSPLTATERFNTAAQQYQSILTAAKGGDADALQSYTETANAFLTEALSYFGRASTQYQDLFGQIFLDSSMLGGDTTFQQPSAADIKSVETAVRDGLRALADKLEGALDDQTSASSGDVARLIAAIDEMAIKISTYNEVTV